MAGGRVRSFLIHLPGNRPCFTLVTVAKVVTRCCLYQFTRLRRSLTLQLVNLISLFTSNMCTKIYITYLIVFKIFTVKIAKQYDRIFLENAKYLKSINYVLAGTR